MIRIISILSIVFCTFTLIAQEEKATIYNPEAKAGFELRRSIQRAKTEHKHVLVQVGGNWCPWCLKLHAFYKSDSTVSSLLAANYIVQLVNYSKENKNMEVMQELGFPQRFGFPVLVILDADGKRIHTQSTGYLEDGEGYSSKAVVEFLRNWSPSALDPAKYFDK